MSNIQDYKCFIIHLKRAQNRKPYVDDIISKLNMTSEIIDAVDGKLLTDNNISKHFNFPDHHRFTDKNIQEIISIFERNKDSVIVTTEKDAMRLKEQKALESLPIFYLPIEVDFIQDKEIFEKLIHNYEKFLL